jgi:hypothetical protein
MLELVTDYSLHNSDGPFITLSKPIVVTKLSNTQVISDYVFSKINDACFHFNLEDNITNSEIPRIVVHYKQFNLF